MRSAFISLATWLVVLSSLAFGQDCTSPDLLGWWPAEADAADGAGDNDGELVGATFDVGRVGSSFALDGAAYVEIDNADALRVSAESPSTLESWIYPTSLPANSWVPVGPCLPYYYGMLYNTGDRLLRANVNDGSRWYYFDAGFQLPLNAWTHVAQTWDGAKLRIYANGQLIGTGIQDGDSYPRLDLPAYIGRWLVTEGNPQEFRFTGLIDEARIYKAALEDSDLHSSYLAGLDGRCPPAPTSPFGVTIREATAHCVDVVVHNSLPINGGEIGIAYDPTIVTIDRVKPGSGLASNAEILLGASPGLNCSQESGVVAGFTVGWVNPIVTGSATPPGDHALLRVCFTLAPGANVGACSPLRFVQCLGAPEAPVLNVVNAGQSGSMPLATTDGEVCIKPDAPFRRGDANGDDSFDISDPISILGCLFLGTLCSKCQDAVDANDDGQANIADPTYLLSWRFVTGAPPPPPFATCGVDDTADQLDECEAFAACP